MSERYQMTESWRSQRQGGFDPQVKRMAILAGGVAVALLVLGGGYSLLAGRPHGVPVIEADSRPVRVKPADPGGMQVIGANEQILNGEGDGRADIMAPPPETPQLAALQAQVQAARQADQPAAPALVAPAQTAVLTVARAPAEAPAASVPMATPARGEAPNPEPHRTVAAASPAPLSGGVQVQLAAVETQAQATSEWARLLRKMPALLNARQPEVVKAQRDGKLLYRLRTGGFTDIAQATEFCTKVRGKGVGCAIANF